MTYPSGWLKSSGSKVISWEYSTFKVHKNPREQSGLVYGTNSWFVINMVPFLMAWPSDFLNIVYDIRSSGPGFAVWAQSKYWINFTL